MDLSIFVRVVRRYWWLMLLPVLVAAALTVPALLRREAPAVSFTSMMRYTAAQQLDAIPNRDGDYQDVWLASELTVNALTSWIRSQSFTQAIITAAAADGVTVDPALLGLAADNERSVGQIFLSYPDAEVLAAVDAAAINVLTTENHLAFPQLGGEPAQVEFLDAPVVVPAPPPLADRFGPLIRIVLALIAGIALALVAYFFDPVLRAREDVEALGLPVIGSIPKR